MALHTQACPDPGQDAAGLATANKRLVIGHVEDFVNRRDLAAIGRNMAPDVLDHDGPCGEPTGVARKPSWQEAARHAA